MSARYLLFNTSLSAFIFKFTLFLTSSSCIGININTKAMSKLISENFNYRTRYIKLKITSKEHNKRPHYPLTTIMKTKRNGLFSYLPILFILLINSYQNAHLFHRSGQNYLFLLRCKTHCKLTLRANFGKETLQG